MSYVVAVVVIFGLFSLLNLVFTLGVVRRLRAHAHLLNEWSKIIGGPVDRPLAARPASFTALTVDGEPLSNETLPTPALVGFFSPRCKPCAEALPGFLERARTVPGGRAHVLAVVSGSSEDSDYLDRLNAFARVIVENPSGPVQTAFAVDGFPAFGILDRDGSVSVAERSIADLPTAVPA